MSCRDTSITSDETESEDIFEDDTSTSNTSETSNKKEMIVNNESKCNNITKKGNTIENDQEDDEDYICLICLDKVEFEDKTFNYFLFRSFAKDFIIINVFKWFNRHHNCPI